VDESSPAYVVVDLAGELADAAGGADGAVCSRETDDLDANLVRLGARGAIGEHRNDEVDVVMVVLSGTGALTLDGVGHDLGPHTLAVLPRGASRAITADVDGLVYLTLHRRRRALGIVRPVLG
jgi:quercetin dioxygenase-like cupin family protein